MQFEHKVNTTGHAFDFDNLSRRVMNGNIVGEVSHPVRRHEESAEAFSRRALTTNLSRTCCAVSGLRLTEAGELIAIIKPAGPRADVLIRMAESGQTPSFGYRAVLDDKNITFIAFDLTNGPTESADLEQRLSDTIAQLTRYGGLYSHAIADLLESLTCLNEDLLHDRAPNCIEQLVDQTKTQLDSLYANYLITKNQTT